MEYINEEILVKTINEKDDSNAAIELNRDQTEMCQKEELQVDMESERNNDNELFASNDGKQRLLESASENETEDVRISLTNKTKRIVDSENEDNDDNQLNYVDDETARTKPLVDDEDGDDELKLNLSSHGEETTQHTRNRKLNSIIDSDSETGNKEKLNKISTLIDSESDEEDESSPETQAKVKTKCLKKKRRFNGLVDSDSEEDEQKQENLLKRHGSEMGSNVIDSHSDSEQSGNETLDAQHDTERKDEKNLPKRSSAKKAIDHMQAIQSEQQRLHREAHISIPYHKPKRYTLQEFLKRRTIQKSQLSREGSNPTGYHPKEGKPLKMTAEELEEYAKLMEERAKEAAEFFKSESDDDGSEQNNSNDHNNTSDHNNSDVKDYEPQTNLNAELVPELEKPNEVIIEESSEKNSVTECISNEHEKAEQILTSQPIVTEVIELPKLDISTLEIAPPTTAEKVTRLINKKQLPDSPFLRGDPNMMIDLETGDLIVKKSTGVDTLLKRFMAAKAQRKRKTSETLSILSTENGKLEISNVNVHITDDSVPAKEPKPRAAYFKLQENLRSIIKKKRLEELKKKKAEKRVEEEEYDKCLGEEEFENGIESDTKIKTLLIDDEENAINDEENAINDEENLFYDKENASDDVNDKLLDDDEEDISDKEDAMGLALVSYNEKSTIDINKGNNTELESSDNEDNDNDDNDDVNGDDDDENVDNDNDDDNDVDDKNGDENDDKDNRSYLDCPKKKNRIIKAFEADSDEENDFLRTPVAEEYSSVKLFNEDKLKLNPTEHASELLKFCSGEFEGTQQTSAELFISQIPVTQPNKNALQVDADNELLELCSGTFGSQPDATPTEAIAVDDSQLINLPASPKFMTKIVSSDEEENAVNVINNEENTNRVKKLTKRVKKNKVKLGFSDDEDSEDEETTLAVAAKEDELSENDEDEKDDGPQTFVDYDSEENEIVVQMTKKDCVMQAEKFFEKEAELSDSEWGSADEDERNLDKYDIELGDEDEFDRSKLQAELGKIHARKMLDEDIREVRLIKEMLLDDEENDGVGRQRQFKWRNMENGFSLNDPNGDGDRDEKGDSEDEENEQLWRKIRYERDQMLREQATKEDVSVTSILNSTTLIGNTTLQAPGSVKKLNIITSKTSTSADATKSSFLIPKSKANDKINKKPVRGSFLERDKETLIKLVGLTKDAAGTAGTVSVKEVKPQNFVFATLTEEEHANLKRKSDHLLNRNDENGPNFMKKPRLEPRRAKCFIDQLL